MHSNHSYLSSYFIVVKVHRCPSTMSLFKLFKEAPGLVLSKLHVIATAALYLRSAVLASDRHFVSDCSRGDGVDKCCFSSGCKKMVFSGCLSFGRLVKIISE